MNHNRQRNIIYKPKGFWRCKGSPCEHVNKCEHFPCWNESKIIKDNNIYYYEHDPNKTQIKNIQLAKCC